MLWFNCKICSCGKMSSFMLYFNANYQVKILMLTFNSKVQFLALNLRFEETVICIGQGKD
jgi:hypothetical protein